VERFMIPIETQTEDVQNRKQELLPLYRRNGYSDKEINMLYMPRLSCRDRMGFC
jgi:hypothetical protein